MADEHGRGGVRMREFSIGEVIKQRRIELGLTQEELCEGIYEPPTMSRIETGRQTPSRTKLNALLQRLGLPDDRYYALLSDRELKIADLQKEIVSCNVLSKQEKGLEMIEELERIADPQDSTIQQFILRSKVILGKLEDGEIEPYSLEQRQEMLMQAIRLTSPKFNLEEIDRGLYSLDEVKIINQIALNFSRNGEHKKAIEIYNQLLRYIKKHFQNILQSGGLLPLVAYNYARQLLLVGRYEDALEIAQLGWQACVRYGQYSTLPEILEIIAESYYYLGEKEKSKEFYYQAYYISKATGNCRETNDVKDNAKKYLGIDFSF